MGAVVFEQFQSGTAHGLVSAFKAAKQQAIDINGVGYTGTLAEKPGFVVIDHETHSLAEARDIADTLIAQNDPRIADKWEAAGALFVKDGGIFGWYLFGWASC
jgi:hypothetical protein